MDWEKSLLQKLLLAAGIIEILIAIVHFVMPVFVFQNMGFVLLKGNDVSFVYLLIYAVGILLLAFGILTIVFSIKIEGSVEILYFYLIVQVGLWGFRVLLEIYYPVELDLFYIDPLTIAILPGLVFELMLFICTLFLVIKRREVLAWEQLK